MTKILAAFKPYDKQTQYKVRTGVAKNLIEYKEMMWHIIIDVKVNLTWKAQNGITTEAPAYLIHSCVTEEQCWIFIFVAVVYDLDIMSCDIGNAFLNTPCRAKIWLKAGSQCREHQGYEVIFKCALYGKKYLEQHGGPSSYHFYEYHLGLNPQG